MKKPKTPAKAAPQISHADHFRLRLPSEKPTIDDAGTDKCVVVYFKDGNSELVADRRYDDCPWCHEAVCWIPGRLPTSLIPKAPTPEELNRQAFEAWASKDGLHIEKPNGHEYAQPFTQASWLAWQAATTLRSA